MDYESDGEDPQFVDNFEEEDERTEKLKSALWFHIGELVGRTTASLGKNATPQFIGALTELVWYKIGETGVDVESFARHAGRTVVTTPDVLLLARRSEPLQDELNARLADLRAENESDGGKSTNAASKNAVASGKGKGKAKA